MRRILALLVAILAMSTATGAPVVNTDAAGDQRIDIDPARNGIQPARTLACADAATDLVAMTTNLTHNILALELRVAGPLQGDADCHVLAATWRHYEIRLDARGEDAEVTWTAGTDCPAADCLTATVNGTTFDVGRVWPFSDGFLVAIDLTGDDHDLTGLDFVVHVSTATRLVNATPTGDAVFLVDSLDARGITT